MLCACFLKSLEKKHERLEAGSERFTKRKILVRFRGKKERKVIK